MATTKKRGVLLMNLGSPDSTEVKDVKRYLNEFLLDERVIDYPFIIRKPLVSGIIVPFRAPKSAEAYKTIWTAEGSPLIVLSKQLQAALQQQVEEPVELTMRYGNPSPEAAFGKLMERMPGLEEVIAIPLYPHYAMSSYETAVEYAKEVHEKNKYPFQLNFIKPYFDQPAYIGALADRIRPFLNQEYDHILFSYHGVPGRHLRKSDVTGKHCLKVNDCCNVPSPAHACCYRHQCFTTTRLVTEKLGIPAARFSLSFQSRLGKGWLEPFTDIRLEQMPKEGIRKLLILCPAFVSDCLETLEEINERGKETFMEAGGESYTMIPCLNTHPLWIQALSGWIHDAAAGSREMLLQ
ncbi:MAG: ferrochelatase [Chitinophagaceae bacterium]|nr:ferrochelatase [Chitinophagaceae bacterium]